MSYCPRAFDRRQLAVPSRLSPSCCPALGHLPRPAAKLRAARRAPNQPSLMRQTGEPVLPPLLLRSVQEPPLRVATPWFDADVFLGIRLNLRAPGPASACACLLPARRLALLRLHFTLPRRLQERALHALLVGSPRPAVAASIGWIISMATSPVARLPLVLVAWWGRILISRCSYFAFGDFLIDLKALLLPLRELAAEGP